MTNEVKFEPVYSENKDWFVSSSAWMGRMSRSLQRMGGPFKEAIDISIQPLNHPLDPEAGHESYEIARLLEMRIRKHVTTEDKGRFTHSVSGGLADCVKHWVGDYFYHLLMHEDLLAEIDQEKFDHYESSKVWPWGGGIPFILIAKNPDKYEPVLQHWFKVLDKEPHYLTAMDEDLIARYKAYQESKVTL